MAEFDFNKMNSFLNGNKNSKSLDSKSFDIDKMDTFLKKSDPGLVNVGNEIRTVNLTSDDYLKQYQKEFKESEKSKGSLYNALLGGNIFAEKSFRDDSDTYKKYLQALENEKKTPNKNISEQISDTVVNFVQNPNLIKGADNWKDGYQAGDILKTAGSTAASLGTSAVKGIVGLGESIGDLGQYGVAQVADWLGADDFANQVRENAKFNATDAIFSPAEEFYSKNSIAGDTSNQIAQGIGYIAGMSAGGTLLPKGTQSINVGKFSLPTTSLVSGMGNSMTEAYNNGASDGEAWTYGALSGLSEAFSESLFGGLGNTFKKVYGGGALDDVVVDKLTKNITNRSMRILAQSGLKALGEGTEEIVSGLGSALAKKLTYMSEEDLEKIVNDENLLDQFIIGTLTSLVAQTPSTIQSVKTGQDYVNLNNQDLSQNKTNLNQADQNIETLPKYSEMSENTTNTSVLENKYQYMPTNNEKVNNFNQTVSKYNFDSSQKTIDMVNTVNKVIQDKGYNVLFDDTIVNKLGNPVNAQIKTVDGEVEIRINPNSPRATEFLLTHEITHAIETDSMKKLILDYASRNAEFNQSLESLKQAYGVEDVSSEVVADISGQLLGNQEFINSLSMQEPSIFKKIYNKIIEFANKITGNSNEALFIKDLKNKWETAYRNTTTEQAVNNLNNDIQYQQAYSNKYGTYWNVETGKDIFKGKTRRELQKSAYNYILNGNNNFEVINDVIDGKTVKFIRISANEYTRGRNSQKLSNDEYNKKMRIAPSIDDLINNSEIKYNSPLTHQSSLFKDGFNNYQGKVRIDDTIFRYIVRVGKAKNDNIFYDVSLENLGIEKGTSGVPSTESTSLLKKQVPLTANNISQQDKSVKSDTLPKYSMQENINNTQELDNSSFSFAEAKQYDDLIKTNYIEYFRKDNGDVKVYLMDSNNNLLNEFSLWSNTNAIKELGENLGNKIYETATDTNQTIKIGNDINNLGTDTDYFMNHRPSEGYGNASNFEENMPDIFEHPEWYLNLDEKYNKESLNALKKVRNNPEAELTIYRATVGNKINSGDWVTPSKSYAEYHNNSQFDGKGNILEMKVKAKDIQFAGDDINEFGYFPNNDAKYSQRNDKWQEHLEKNYKATGTRTNMQELKGDKLPTYSQNNRVQESSEIPKKKILNPTEISKLRPENASTTLKLPTAEVTTGDGESSFYENITEKTKMLSDESRNIIGKENEVEFYKKVTNQESLDKAYDKLNTKGTDETLRWFNQKSENATDVDVAEGWILLKQYQDSGDYDSMVQVAKKMREIGTKAGQTVQAFNIMERLTPEGMVKYAQSELSEAYDKMVKNKTKEWIDKYKSDFDLTPNEVQFIIDTMQEVQQMKDGYDKKVKLAEIQKLMTDKLPPEQGAGIKSWMRISMLFNPKTQVRNVMGNAVIAPVNMVGDKIASVVDKAISKKTGVRTTGSTNLKNYASGFKTGLYQSYNDFKKGINTRNIEGNRFEISQGKSFNNKTTIGKSLNKVDSLLSFMLDAGDRGFYEASFTNSINNQLILNNTTEVTQEMIDIATQEALSRTWQDNNNYTKFVLNIRKGLNAIHVPGKEGYGLGDVLIPFAKTPANLTKAIIDYSPAGLVNTIISGKKLKRSLSNGQYNAQMQHQFVQNLGKATAGTMLYILGYALAKTGISSGESDEDKDVANFMKNTLGISSYSIKIGDKTFTYDWAQPVAAPFAMMANLVQKQKENTNLFENITATLDTGLNVVFEQSFLSSLSNVLSESGQIGSKLTEQMLELPSRAIPTLSKQIADLIDGTQRQSFVYGKPLETALNKAKAKIPGLSQTLSPSVDTLGRNIQKYGGNNNIFNVFLNPANVNTKNISESAKEIYRVYKETGDSTVMPRQVAYYINTNGEKITLTNKERAEYQKISGQIIEDNVKQLLNNSYYKKMSDEDKASVLNDIVDYSYNKARKDVLGLEMSNTYNKVNEWIENGGKVYEYYANKEENNYSLENPQKYQLMTNIKVDYYDYNDYKKKVASIKETYSGTENTNKRKQEVFKYINSLNYNKQQKIILYNMLGGYSIKEYQNELFNYVNNLKLSKSEKETMWQALYGS